jgi:hypothetical protein
MTERAVDRRAHDVIPITHSVAHLNQDFLEITQRRTSQALADVEPTCRTVDQLDLLGYPHIVAVAGALAQSADDKPEAAERMLRDVLEQEPGRTLAVRYVTLLKRQPINTADAADIDDVEPTPFYAMGFTVGIPGRPC